MSEEIKPDDQREPITEVLVALHVDQLDCKSLPLKWLGWTPKYISFNKDAWEFAHEEKPTYYVEQDRYLGGGSGYEIGGHDNLTQYLPKSIRQYQGAPVLIEIIDPENFKSDD